ncbi:tail fiber domain-containing protein [uncultured Lacinutrix sp.]|uniref:tail fiber domain-containing protein n=1 Tax=uncultured Lacinutrix sp. TaxID=574032 RepID=UPI002618195E|nr:tail fiber domain-containing protein [uncultured Lacinutrix sp.]
MKRAIIILIILIPIISFSQTPQGFNYQSVIRDALGDVLPNTTIGVQFELRQATVTGTVVYTESHTLTTNTYGVMSTIVGQGTTSDDFTAIDWSSDLYFIEISIDVSGGTSYVSMGTTQLQSVPYAIHAKTVENGDDLGSHTATENVQLGSYYISNDGDDEGLTIDDEGRVLTSNVITLGENQVESDAVGSVRYNPDTEDFEGYKNGKWYSLTGYSLGSNNLSGTQTALVLGASEVQASNETTNDRFGDRVAIDGDIAAVTAYADSSIAGQVYIFVNDGVGNWTEQTILSASDAFANDDFGRSVAIEGNKLVVGAISQTNTSGIASGKAYLFEYDGAGTWTETAIFEPSDGADGDRFGEDIDIEGDMVLVGARNAYVGGGAYSYKDNGNGTWTENALEPTIASNYDQTRFGEAVVLSNGKAYLGGPDRYNSGSAQVGAVQIFEQAGDGTWSITQDLRGSASYRFFGTSIAIDGEYMAVGAACQSDSCDGRVYIYKADENGDYLDTNRVMVQNDDKDSFNNQQFASDVVLDGNYLYVSCFGGGSGTEGDAVYVFENDGNHNWAQIAKITHGAGYFTWFGGKAIAFSSGTLVVGAKYTNFPNDSGAVYFIPIQTQTHPGTVEHNSEMNGNWISGDGEDEGMYVDTEGNIGVGTDSPSEELHVVSSAANNTAIRITPSAGYNPRILFDKDDGTSTVSWNIGSNSTDDSFNFYDSLNDNSPFRIESGARADALYIDANGYVGIGESVPQTSLDVVDTAVIGNISIGSESTDQAASGNSGLGYITTPWIYTNAIEAQSERGTGSTSIIIGNDGNYGANDEIHFVTDGDSQVNITDGLLYVAGSIEYTGTITDVSDRRLKENIKPVEKVLDKLNQINGYSYNMINDKSKQREYGVMAQDVLKVFPEMVKELKDKEGYYGVNYIQLIPALLEGIKEQQKLIDNQNVEIENLKKEIKLIKELIMAKK